MCSCTATQQVKQLLLLRESAPLINPVAASRIAREWAVAKLLPIALYGSCCCIREEGGIDGNALQTCKTFICCKEAICPRLSPSLRVQYLGLI
jgi:hypothetical protein